VTHRPMDRDAAAAGWTLAQDAPPWPALQRALDEAEIERLLGFDVAPAPPPGGLSAILKAGAGAGERLPMLELVFDRLGRALPTALRTFTGDIVEASAGEIAQARFGDYLAAAPPTSVIAVFRACELDNLGLVLVEPDLVYALLDVLLGGRRAPPVRANHARPVTAIERALVQRLVEIVLEALGNAFAPVAPLRFALERLETNPRLAVIDRPSGAAVMAPFRIDMGERGGGLEIVLPHATLEPIKVQLRQSFAGETPAVRDPWSGRLAAGLRGARLELEAVLAERRMPLSRVLALKVGDVLPLGAPGGSVELRAGGVALAKGDLGRRDQTIAVRLEAPVAARRAGLARAPG